ncbi:MAG: hypothetical protein JWP37_789 [Mucilaginibacter sp.]|nr:hypothetical protein [Mucilaginibacter sp.]
MNFFYLFLVVGVIIVFIIIQYDKLNKKKVDDILRANKNVPPLFMLRSAELKVIAIKSALNTADNGSAELNETKKTIAQQLDKLMFAYRNRDIALAAYYAKLGALLISASELKKAQVAVEA